MLSRVFSAALPAIAPRGATADGNGIEAFPIEVEVNSGRVTRSSSILGRFHLF
jgi:hypothetical protein